MLSIDEQDALGRFWRRAAAPPGANEAASNWKLELRALFAFGVSLDAAMAFLFQQRPDESAFLAWVAAHGRIAVPAVDETARPLSAAERAFWDENGYLVLRGVVPRQQCEDACTAIWDYLGASPGAPASWYWHHPGKRGLMLEFAHHPALERNRASAAIRHAYEQLYGSTALFRSFDKVSFNPPETASYRFMGSPLHWDVSLRPPVPFELQGLLYLGDCTAADGAFQCVPGFHRRLEPWLREVPAGVHPREWAVRSLAPEVVAVPGQAGDFIIWHQALPHCASPNHGAAPRLVQYLTYSPECGSEQGEWY